MTLTTFQKLLSELLAQYNQEAENHAIKQIDLTANLAETMSGKDIVIDYEIEIKTIGK